MVLIDVERIEQDLVDYADFEEVRSVVRAQMFQTAAKRWLILRADSASNQSSSLTLGKQYVENMLLRARAYATANDQSISQVRVLHPGRFYRG